MPSMTQAALILVVSPRRSPRSMSSLMSRAFLSRASLSMRHLHKWSEEQRQDAAGHGLADHRPGAIGAESIAAPTGRSDHDAVGGAQGFATARAMPEAAIANEPG